MEFKSQKIKVDLDWEGLKNYFADKNESHRYWDCSAEVTVEFEAELVTRSWGVASLSAYATCVDGEVKMSRPKEVEGLEYSDEVTEDNFEIHASLLDSSQWKIASNIKLNQEGELLLVTEVIINIFTKEIFVS